MADTLKGLVPILRDIQSHWLWKYKPFSKGQAWIDMILSANHQDNKVLFEGSIILVKRGEFVTSQFKLADRWGWSRQQVRTFLALLQDPTPDLPMIKCQNLTNRATKLTITKYNELQKFPTKSITNEQPTSNQPATINKNVKKEKNDNKDKYIEFVFLTKEEHTKLQERFGASLTEEFIGKLSDYIGSTGKKYKSHYHTICMWIDRMKSKPKTTVDKTLEEYKSYDNPVSKK